MTLRSYGWHQLQDRFRSPLDFVVAVLNAQYALSVSDRELHHGSPAHLDNPLAAERILREVFNGHPVKSHD